MQLSQGFVLLCRLGTQALASKQLARLQTDAIKHAIFTVDRFALLQCNMSMTLVSFHPQPALGIWVFPSSKEIECRAG